MANCIQCGRKLPSFSLSRASDTCFHCRKAAATSPALTSSTNTPVPGEVVRRQYPPVTTALVAINIGVFVAMVASGISITEPTTGQLLKWGADWGPLSLSTQPWRMLTSNYLHIGIIHIFFNMWCLWNLGHLAERIFDRWTYFLIYTSCGLAGSLSSLWRHPQVVGAGASGAIFGLAGALIAALYLGKLRIPKEAVQQTLKSLLTFAGYNLFLGTVGAGIDNSAHIGGLVTGLLLGAALAKHLEAEREIRNQWRFYIFTAMALLLFAGTSYVKSKNASNIPREKDSEPSAGLSQPLGPAEIRQRYSELLSFSSSSITSIEDPRTA